VSPNTGITLDNSLFKTYYGSYVDQVWSKYTDTALTVDTQGSAGDVTAKVSNGKLAFSAGSISYDKPSTADIWSNSSGAFAVSGDATKDAITARLAAAFNRSTLLIDTNQPNGETVSNYYQNAVTNHYSRICHATTLDNRGYAFPYDDVAPTNGADQSGSVYDPNPQLLTVTVGGSSSNSTNRSANQGSTTPTQGNQKKSRFAGLKKVMKMLSCNK
jgi:hypothetical protein